MPHMIEKGDTKAAAPIPRRVTAAITAAAVAITVYMIAAAVIVTVMKAAAVVGRGKRTMFYGNGLDAALPRIAGVRDA